MKKIAFNIAILVILIVFVGCKNESDVTENTETAPIENINDLALADTASEEIVVKEQFLYVTAGSGLSLREFNNLNSDKIAKMPYGTKVKVITSEEKNTMTVGGIKGGMHEVEFNHKTGFAFNGYLSKLFPPEKEMNAKGYADELKLQFPKVTYAETIEGTASMPINTETLVIPTNQWHEAYFIAKRLFDIPSEFGFPNPKGKEEQIIKDSKPKKDVWTSELRVTRKNNTLETIEYIYTAKKFSSKVSVVKDGEFMKVSRSEAVQ